MSLLLLAAQLLATPALAQESGVAEPMSAHVDSVNDVSTERPPRKIRFRRLNNRDGLSYSQVDSILQDRRGFLWFGTLDGLNRFDGSTFRVYRTDSSNPESLTPGILRALVEDDSGRLWIAADSGLDRFDPVQEKFTHFRHDPADSNSLNQNAVRRLLVDQRGNLWIGTKKGLDRFDPATETFTHYLHDPKNPNSPSHGQINGIEEDSAGGIWIATLGGLDRLDPETGTFTHYRQDPDGVAGPIDAAVWSVYEDRAGTLWVGTAAGLSRFEQRTNRWRHDRFHPGDPRSLGPGAVHKIYEDRAGNLWFGSWGGGISVYDPEDEAFTVYRHDSGDPTSLSHDVVVSIAEDDQGGMWFGTFGGGANYYHPLAQGFQAYQHRPGDPESLSPGAVWSVVEGRDSELWLGMMGGGVSRFDPSAGKARHYRHDPKHPEGLPSNLVVTLEKGISDDLWIGMERGGLSRFDPRSETFTNYRHDSENPDSLSDESVYSILAVEEEGREVVWIGTDYGGLNRFDVVDERFTHYRHDPENPESLSRDGVILLVRQDRAGMIWIGTLGGGLNRLDPRTEIFKRFLHDPEDPRSLSNNLVVSFLEDRSGTLWIGTLGGALNRLDSDGGFTRFEEHQTIASILEDDDGRLWMSSLDGIRSFDPVQGKTVYYDVGDGLSDNEFKGRSKYVGRDGAMYFGSLNGLTAFKPSEFSTNVYRPPVVLTKFELFGREVPLERSITHLDSIELDHHENFFAFEYSALSFHRADKNRYAYQLEGLDEDWVEIGTRRRAGYTKVPPGDYVFRVRGSNNDGVWNQDGVALRLVVRPPWWKTWWAYLFYVFALSAGVAGYLHSHRKELAREREAAEQERRVNARLREVDRLKDEFLANTSHELRTPLYGMTGLAESLLDGVMGELPTAVQGHLRLIVASGRRLSGLVNDILDFSKLNHKSIELQPRSVDVCTAVDVALTLAGPLVGNKNVVLEGRMNADLPLVRADEQRLEQILLNLIGNAVKFTEEGSVTVSAVVDGNHVRVEVSDTGVGIAPEDRERIFEAFEQAEAADVRSFGGAGLGLAVTKQLVNLHGGVLGVESTLGQGATFFFTLPIDGEVVVAPAVDYAAVSLTAEDSSTVIRPLLLEDLLEGSPHRSAESSESPLASPTVLIVDDEPVNRQVLINQLALEGYRLLQASNGPEALRLVEEHELDLILLDVMMPKMSGYEVCREIRRRIPSEKLPVIFLTAKSQVKDLADGFESGGTDYLNKPIARSELISRVRSHLGLAQANRDLELRLDENDRLIGELERTNAELARFNLMVSHDLKNPLTTIGNFLGVARTAIASGRFDGLDDDLQRIQAATDQMQRLLEDLLRLTHASRQIHVAEDVALRSLVEDAVEQLDADFQKLGIDFRIAEDLPIVVGDRGRLLEVFQHLLENAIKFLGDQEDPRIEISCRSRENEVEILVTDNGLGVDPQYRDKIFDLFRQLDARSEGTGIGLTLVKRIVEAHGGRIWAEAAESGSGSCFHFTLPVGSE